MKKINFDGIFASSDLRASGALQALKQNGLDVPGQVKVIGFDDTKACCAAGFCGERGIT